MVDPTKPIMLPEVVVTAKKTDPKKYKTTKVKLYPSSTIEKSTIDSLHKAGRGKLIGEPIKMEGQIAVYGPDASDKIKRLIKRR